MQRFLISIFILIFLNFPITYTISKDAASISNKFKQTTATDYYDLYTEMGLNDIVNFTVFEKAMTGYDKLNVKNKDIITMIDFSKPSTEERLYVIDVKEKKLLYSSVVSHGRNSGGNYATSFSNKVGSYQSSLGFYVTENTYIGKNGYSLVINGLEKGFNHKAKERAVVIHGAPYSNPSVIASSGRLGRSQGCPALPQKITKPIIDTIKNGTLLFIYAENNDYLTKSTILSDNAL